MTMKNRIEDRFMYLKEHGQKGLITYVTAGDPNLKFTKDLVLAMAKAGADIIELGIPHSDPVADGPTIQQASLRALQAGTTLAGIFELVQEIRQECDVPLVLMTYVNPILQYGVPQFMAQAAAVGVDGLIVPDVPLEEMDLIRPAALDSNLCLIPLVAPTSTPDRIQTAGELATGFIYCVSITGVTGVQAQASNNIEEFIGLVNTLTTKPVAIGFGISNPQQAAKFAQQSDAVIVGSAIVKLVETNKNTEEMLKEVAKLVSDLKNGINGNLQEDA